MVAVPKRPLSYGLYAVALIILAMMCLWRVQDHLTMTMSDPDIKNDSRAPEIPWQVAFDTYEAERQLLLQDYDTEAVSNLFATISTSISPNLTEHVSRLRSFVEEYFEGSSISSQLGDTIQRLENHQRPNSPDSKLPKRVWSTNKGGTKGLAWYFNRWKRFLGPLGWEITVMGDPEMEEMLPIFVGGPCRGSERFQKLWDALPTPALKGDLLR